MAKAARSIPRKPIHRRWRIGGVDRHAMIFMPAKRTRAASPVVFVFHGHTGTTDRAARHFRVHKLWPEAIVAYLQGLNTPGKFDREGKFPGWQHFPGDEGDRDLKFFDAVWTALNEKFPIDVRRVYAAGHSNGGQFVYVLWKTHGNLFAALAASAGVPMAALLKFNLRSILKLRPKPIMQIAGRQDEAIKVEVQQRAVKFLCKLNQCSGAGRTLGHKTLYPSDVGSDVLAFVHPGGHPFPPQSMSAMVKFFQQHTK